MHDLILYCTFFFFIFVHQIDLLLLFLIHPVVLFFSTEVLYHAYQHVQLLLPALNLFIAAFLAERSSLGLKCFDFGKAILLGLILVDVYSELLKLLLVIFDLALVL